LAGLEPVERLTLPDDRQAREQLGRLR